VAGFLVKLAIEKGKSKLAEKGFSSGGKGGDPGGGSPGKSSASKGIDYGSSSAAGGAGNLSKRQLKRAQKYSD
jgi:hypothetical protein